MFSADLSHKHLFSLKTGLLVMRSFVACFFETACGDRFSTSELWSMIRRLPRTPRMNYVSPWPSLLPTFPQRCRRCWPLPQGPLLAPWLGLGRACLIGVERVERTFLAGCVAGCPSTERPSETLARLSTEYCATVEKDARNPGVPAKTGEMGPK